MAPLAPLYSAQEPPTAARIAELRSDAEQGDANAQDFLGDLYYNGRSVAQNYVEARKWYRQAAGQDHALAQYSLGFLYQNGQGGAQDYVETRRWYLKAAEQGRALAQYSLT